MAATGGAGGAGGACGACGDGGLWFPWTKQFVYVLSRASTHGMTPESVDEFYNTAPDARKKLFLTNNQHTCIWVVCTEKGIIYIKTVTMDPDDISSSCASWGYLREDEYCEDCLTGKCTTHGCGFAECPYMRGCSKHWCQKHLIPKVNKITGFRACRCSSLTGCFCDTLHHGSDSKEPMCPQCVCPNKYCSSPIGECKTHKCMVKLCTRPVVTEWNNSSLTSRCDEHSVCLSCEGPFESTMAVWDSNNVFCNKCVCKERGCYMQSAECRKHMCPCGVLAIPDSTPRRCKKHLKCCVTVRRERRGTYGVVGGTGGAGGAGKKSPKKKLNYEPCGRLTCGNTLVCDNLQHLCRRCKIWPIFKTSSNDRADFLKKLRFCRQCLVRGGFFNCSMSAEHGRGVVSRVYLPMTRQCVEMINAFLGFGSSMNRRGVIETTLCVGFGNMSTGGKSIGVSIKCSLMCMDCTLSWASSLTDKGVALRRLCAHPSFATEALRILEHNGLLDEEDSSGGACR